MNKNAIKLPTPKPEQEEDDDSYKILKFRDFKNKEEIPYVVYVDFESLLVKVNNDSRKLNEHKPCAVGYYFICNYDDSLSYYRDHVGLDSATWFVQELKTLANYSHLTGKFRGPAHSNCNIKYNDWRTIPVVFYNLTGYDSHFFIEALANCYEGRINLITLNKEKYHSFIKFIDGLDVCLKFIDSFRL